MKQIMDNTKSTPKIAGKQKVVQSVSRALDLLEIFLELGPEIGLTEIASALQLNKATTYHLLSTLEGRRFLERPSNSRQYRLGSQLLELGSYYQSQLDIHHVALPILTTLAEKTNWTAFLVVPDGDEALCVERIEGNDDVRIFHLRVGSRLPLHAGAGPRVLLSGKTDDEILAYAKRTQLRPSTPKTISSIEKLMVDVKRTRKQGYAISCEDVNLGVAAIGAPIRDYSNQVIAAVSLSSLTIWFGEEKIPELAAIIKSAAEQISIKMGVLVSRKA